MANALELHRQLKENSKKNTVIDMADIQNITSRIRGEQNFAPLRNSTQNVPQNFNFNVSSNVMPKSFYNTGNQNTERNLLNNSIDTADGAAFPMSLHKSEEIKLPSLPSLGDARASAVATQDTTDNLVNSAVDNKKAELLANVAKFGALANTAFLPYQAGKEKRDSINNAYDTMMNNTQDKKYSGYSNEELADAYKNIPNYNIVERMFDPKKSAAYGVKQDLSQYAMADAYNKIISQGGKFGEYNALPSRNYEDNYIPALQSNDTSYLKPYADKYGVDVDVLNMLVNAKASGDLEKSYKEFANEHPVASSAASVPANVLGAIPATLYGLKNAATGEVIDTNSPLYGGRKFASDVREEVSSGIDNNLGKFAYNTGMSMGDSLASMALGSAVGSAAGAAGVGASTASAIGSNAGTAIMGMGAYSDTLKEGIERGLTPSQAQLTALGAGLAEYGFEKISWGRLGDIADGKVDASFLKKVASQMLTEGGEEVGTDLTNTFIDNLVNGGASELMQQRRALVAQGYDEKTAEALVVRNYAKQLGMSFAGGAVSGGVMGAGASVINTGRNIRANLAAAQNVDTQADTNTNIAPEMDMLNPASIFNGNNTKTTTESNQNTEFNPLKPETIFKGQNTVDNAGETSYNENVNGNIDLQEEGTNYGRSNGETEQNGQFGNDRADEGIQRNAEELSGFDNGFSSGGENTGGNSGLNREFLLIDNDSRQKLNNSGVTDNEFRDTSSNPELFSFALEEGKKNNKNGIMVDSHTAQDLRDGNVRTFLSKDNNAGGAIEADGNIIAVFKNKQSASKQAGADIIITALENGGDRLDCYGKDLVRIYSKLGFEPVARVKFNKEYAAPGWDSNIHGEPDIYFMVHNGKSVSDVVNDFTNGTSRNFTQEELDALPYMEYDEAKDYRDGLIEQRKAPDVSGQNVTPQNAVNVNTERQTFSGTKKVNSMPEMSKNLQRYVNMHGSDTAQQLYVEFNDKMNTALENGDMNAFNEALELADAIEADLQEHGHNYTTKGSKNGKKPGRTYTYEANSFADTVTDYFGDMNQKYLEARNRNNVSADTTTGRTIPAEMDNGTVSMSEKVDMSQFAGNQTTQNNQATTQNATASEQYTGRTITNTIMNSEMVKRAQENLDAFKDEIDNGGFKVDKVSEKASIEKAANNLSADYDGTVKRLNEATQFSSGVEVDESMMVLDDMLKQAEQSRDYKDVMKWTRMLVDKAHNAGQALQALAKYTRTPAGTVAKGQEIMRKQTEDFMNEHPNVDKAVDESIDTLWAELEAAQNNADALTIGDEKGAVSREQVEKIVRDAANKNKNSGLDKMSQSDIDHLVNEIQSGVDHTLIAEEVQNYAATGLFGLTDEDIANIMDYLGEAEKMPDSKERYELEDKAFQIIADKVVTKNFMDKLDSWRYLAMLSNPKTTLRNYLGNQVNRVTTGVSNSIAGLIESKLSQKYNIKRTKEVLTKADSELVQKATADAEQNAYSLLRDGGDKYRNAQSRIEQSKSAFSTKAMQKVEDLTSRMLDDFPAMRKKYGTSLAGYMKANDMDMSYFNVADDLKAAKAELASLNTETDGARIKELTGQISTLEAKQNKMDTARAYAVTKAKEATFHEYSAFASWISKVSNNWKDGNMLQKFGHLVIEGILPFKKTPANVMKQGAKLATGPVQTGIGLYQLYNALSSGRNGGKYDATAAIERISTGLTGSGILALGALLSNLGLIVSVPDDDKDNNFNKLTGGQNYALKLGDNYYTIDWLSPVSIPLFAGVNAEMMFADKTDKSVLDVLGDLSAPLVEMSMLQGLSETLETATQSDDANNALVRMGTSAATNYASQYVPTMLGQVARTVDNTRRNNVGNDKGVVGDLQYAANKVENKIPFLSMTNEPYVDAWGNQQKDENNILFRGLYNAFSPGYYSKQDKDAVEKELDVVRTSTDDSSVYPSNAPRQINTANGSVRLTEKEYTKYATAKGQMQYKAVNNLIKSEMYDNLTDAQKVDVIKDIYKYSGLVAQNDIGKPAKSTEAVDAYKNDGIKGIVNLAISKNVGGDKAFQVLQDLGEEGYNQYWQIKSEADADGNNSLKQAEVKEYLDKQVMLNERKAYWFDIYCPKAKTNPYRHSSGSTSSSTSSSADNEYLNYVRGILGN